MSRIRCVERDEWAGILVDPVGIQAVLFSHLSSDDFDALEREEEAIDVGGELVAAQVNCHRGTADNVRINFYAIRIGAFEELAE